MDFNRLRYSGLPPDFPVWRIKYIQFASMNGCLGYINGTEKVPSRTPKVAGDPLDPADVIKINAHDAGYGELLLAMEDNKIAMLVGKSVSTENPSGDLRIAWERLEEKYCQKNTSTKLELIKEIQNNKLTRNKKPDDWFDQLEDVRTTLEVDYKHKIDDE